MTSAKRSLATLLAAMTGLVAMHSGALAADAPRTADRPQKSGPSKFETVAPLSDERWSIDWSPSTNISLPAVAAYGPAGLPVVLYNPRLLSTHPRPIAKFLAMRQEVVAMVSEGARKQNIALRSADRSDAGYSATAAGVSRFVPEAFVYPLVARYGAFGNLSQVAFAPHVVDCFALLFMTSDERLTVAFYANENSRFFADAFDPPHDLMARGRALTDCPAMDPAYDQDRARQGLLNDWGASSSR